MVARIYCALTKQQRAQPSSDFAELVRRTFALDPQGADRAQFNRAAFVALAVLVVDDRAAELADINTAALASCKMQPVPAAMHGRQDWPKHWALSAAIAVTAGTQFSEAVGEWKELADSIARNAAFAGASSGFSLTDIAADRSGFLIAKAASNPASAERVSAALAAATTEQILPAELTTEEDGLTSAEFTQRYGAIDDPRFEARIGEIDAVLARSGLR